VILEGLKQFLDKTVTLHMADGETLKVRVVFIDNEYEDIIADVVESSQPEPYRDPSAVYTGFGDRHVRRIRERYHEFGYESMFDRRRG
jgi:hypothetical protein